MNPWLKRAAWLALLMAGPVPAAVEVETENLRLSFADNGDLLSATACLPACQDRDAHRLTYGNGSDERVVSFTSFAAEEFSLRREEEARGTQLHFENADGNGRSWLVPQRGFGVELSLSGSERIDLQGGAAMRPLPAAGFGVWLEGLRYVVFEDGAPEVSGLDEPLERKSQSEWAGFRNRFWTLMVLPDQPVDFSFAGGAGLEDASAALTIDPAARSGFSLYLGPVEPAALRSADPRLRGLMYSGIWFWMAWIAMGLHWLLGLIQGLLPHWGLAIMLLSLAVSFLMRPLSNIADRLQDQVHETEGRLAPELREIQSKYKGEEQSRRILELYKEHGVHPLYSLKSLAGVAVVIPVFIGAFDMLAENIWLAGESFLWITDLARPDAVLGLPFTIPFFGAQLNLLPFIMTALSVLASVLHHHEAMDAIQRRKQRRNLTLMALAFLALFYTFPAGMVLYWTTNNLISVIKYGLRRRQNSGTAARQDTIRND